MMYRVRRRGMPKATGRFEHRWELEEFVFFMYKRTKMKKAQIARAARVSEGVVGNILNFDWEFIGL